MRGLLCTLAFALASTPALADPPEAETDSRGRALIAQASADGVFELESSAPESIVIRHPRSGLVCLVLVAYSAWSL